MPPVLGYWNFRGCCEPIRLLLHYKNVPFEDKRYIFGTEDWQKEKFSLGLVFPNLPYYIDDSIKITQSKAILRYLAQKHDMEGRTEEDKINVSMVEQQTFDLLMHLGVQINFKEKFVKDDPEFKERSIQLLKLFESYLGDREYVAGSYITYADFMLYEILDFYRLYDQSFFEDCPTLKAYIGRIRKLPELQDYWNGSEYKSWPIVGPVVKWGGGGPEPEHSFKNI